MWSHSLTNKTMALRYDAIPQCTSLLNSFHLEDYWKKMVKFFNDQSYKDLSSTWHFKRLLSRCVNGRLGQNAAHIYWQIDSLNRMLPGHCSDTFLSTDVQCFYLRFVVIDEGTCIFSYSYNLMCQKLIL